MANSNEFNIQSYLANNTQFKFHDVIKLSKENSISGQITTIEEFWDVMPLYMLKLVMSSNPDSRLLPTITQPNQLNQGSQRRIRAQYQAKLDNYTNPMDVFIYIFLKSNPLMRQIIVRQVNKCQLSLPLVIKDIRYEKPIIFPFAYENLIQTYITSDGYPSSFHVSDKPLDIISFIRIGKCKQSCKSKLMNEVLGFKHHCFFNKNSKGWSVNRLLYDGTIEMTWYLPKKGSTDKLSDHPLTFFNLRGNAFDYAKQTNFIFKISTMICIILSYKDLGDNEIQELRIFIEKFFAQICLIFFTEDNDDKINDFFHDLQFVPDDRNVIIEDNIGKLAELVKTSITEIVANNTNSLGKFSFRDCNRICKVKEIDFQVEETNKEFNNHMKYFNKSFLYDALKFQKPEEYLPLQNEGWKKYAQIDRKKHKLRHEKDLISIGKGFYKEFTLHNARKVQLNSIAEIDSSHHKFAINNLQALMFNSENEENILHMLTLLKIELEKWSIKSPTSNAINVSHFIRELGQYYEMHLAIGEDLRLDSINKSIQIECTCLPSIFAKLLLLGQPLEIFDGEAQHIPITWIENVLRALTTEINNGRVFVLGVLGIQSSGKSTLLNAMFGLQFPVASGRCTRGISMQIIPVDEEYANTLNYDYLIILDSEGLRSLENIDVEFAESNNEESLENSNKIITEKGIEDMKTRDNELTTFIIGISDICIINIYGENYTEWLDIFQTIIIALMKLTSCTNSKPKCLFVHQNISDPGAKENLKAGYQKFLLKLNQVTHFISNKTKTKPIYSKFTDIVHFDIDQSIYFLTSLHSIPPPMSIISKDYVNDVQSLKQDIIFNYSNKKSEFTLSCWVNQIKIVWKSILSENFVSSYREILERFYRIEFEKNLLKWSQDYACEIEEALLQIKDQILNANYEEVMSKAEEYKSQIIEKCKTILGDEEKKFKQDYFVKHKEKKVFNNWANEANLHFKNTRLEYQLLMEEKILNVFQISNQNQQLLNDFNGKRKIILERARRTKSELLSETVKVKNEELFEQYFEGKWQKWITDLKLSEAETPRVNLNLLLIEEINILATELSATNEELAKIKSFFKLLEENSFPQDDIIISNNHYSIFSQNGTYSCCIDLEDSAQEMNQDFDSSAVPENGQTRKVINLRNKIFKLCDNPINNDNQFSCDCFKHIIKTIINCVNEFNINERMATATLQKIRIENLFIYEVSLVLCTKLIISCKEKHRLNQMDSLKLQLKSTFKSLYNGSNYSVSMACANGLATLLSEKMNLTIASMIQFSYLRIFSYSSSSPVFSKYELQASILMDLANEPSFEQYLSYIENPIQGMRTWILKKFKEYCTTESTIELIVLAYDQFVEIVHNCYTETLRQSLISMEEKASIDQEYAVKVEDTKNYIVNPNWKSIFHKLLDGEFTREFRLSDLDAIIIEPHEITSPDEFVSFFAESLEKNNLKSCLTFISEYLVTDVSSDILIRNLFNCDEICPLCKSPCLLAVKSPEHKHDCGSFHIPLGLIGWYKLDSGEFIGHDCTHIKENIPDIMHRSLDFDTCLQKFEGWNQSRNLYMIESVYWEWVMCQYKDQFASYYGYYSNGKAIKAWSKLTKSEAIYSLKKQTKDFKNPSFLWRIGKKFKNWFSPSFFKFLFHIHVIYISSIFLFYLKNTLEFH